MEGKFWETHIFKKKYPSSWYLPVWHLEVSRFFQDFIWSWSKFQILGLYGLIPLPFEWKLPVWYLEVSKFFQDFIWSCSKFQILGPYGLILLSPTLTWSVDDTLGIVFRNAENIFKSDFVISILDNCSFRKKNDVLL